MKEYVLGFVFDTTKDITLLLRKTKPEWQAGLLNGVGGKVEAHDYGDSNKWPEEMAMNREWMEESLGTIGPLEWKKFGHFYGNNSNVHAFKAFASSRNLIKMGTVTNDVGEDFEMFPTQFILSPSGMKANKCVPNLAWLIPLALDETMVQFEVEFR
jgi:8-oxo-dGTP diphosphatase